MEGGFLHGGAIEDCQSFGNIWKPVGMWGPNLTPLGMLFSLDWDFNM